MEVKPLVGLADGTSYTLRIDEGVESMDGLPLGESFSFSFTTTE